jgi:hypothetical protein
MINKVTLTGLLASDPEKMFKDGCWSYTRMAVRCDEVVAECITTNLRVSDLLLTIQRGDPITIKGSLTNDYRVQVNWVNSPKFKYQRVPDNVQDIDDVWWD